MYEQGNREPYYETLQKIADYYKVLTVPTSAELIK